jgi:hypothetical protein
VIKESWDIKALEVLESYGSFQNVVIGIQWVQYFVSDHGNSINHGWSRLVLPIEGSSFIEYSSLTPEVLLSWVESSHSPSDLQLWSSDSLRQIANMGGYIEEVVERLPWSE